MRMDTLIKAKILKSKHTSKQIPNLRAYFYIRRVGQRHFKGKKTASNINILISYFITLTTHEIVNYGIHCGVGIC